MVQEFKAGHLHREVKDMDNIIIVGSSGHAKVVIDIVQQEGRYNIIGLLDRYRDVDEQTLGYSILGKEEDLPKLRKTYTLKGVLIAIGDNYVRSSVAKNICDICPDLQYVSAIHPKASVATDVSLGEGTVVMAGVSVNPGSSVGRLCILNTHSSLDHDSILENYASLAPHATTGGNCRIGKYTAICMGAILKHGVHVGEHSVIGAASLVMNPIDPFAVAYGIPAKIVRKRKQGEKYL